ncbi:MAG TPA: prolyl oligopeptidase family serine peptidase [Candidatus Acidoferrales bacterium]|nr:prolyl oligopeptidase family serine peptidase [Candidatus Acidoferrales bacterium]
MMRKILAAGMLAGGALWAAAYLAAPAISRADEGKNTAQKEPWKPADFIYSEAAGQYRISPDGKWLVWVKSVGDKEKDARVSNLFLSDLEHDREIQLTRGSDNDSQPVWSPDGERIAFLSTRARPHPSPDAARMQLWLINPHGGEPWPVTELANPPRRIEWLDKDTIIYSAEEEPTLYAQEIKKKKDDSEVVEDMEHTAPVRLFKVNVKDKKITRLTTNNDWIEDWGVSRDGKYAAASHARSLRYAFDQKTPPVIFLHDLTNGAEKQILTEGRIRAEAFDWAPDSSGFYVATPYSTDARFMTAGIAILYYYDVASGKSQQVNLDWANGLSFALQTVPGGFVAMLAAGSHNEPALYTKDGDTWKRQMLEGEHVRNMEGFSISEDGKSIAYGSSTASKLSQLYAAHLDGAKIVSPVQVTKLNEGLVNGRVFAKSEVIRWKGSNDEEVEGILYYPVNYESGKKYPVITAIHGGPMGADHDLWGESWAYPIQLFTERGAFVLRPNYHGSNNYGLKWAESICCGKYYDLETPDINMGVDYLIAKGMVDPDRVGTMGWSNGSILSTSLITTYPDRYKVASVGAGDVEWISDWANVDFGQSFDAYYFGKSPFEDPELYIRKSPFFKMDRVKAPVLIFHGSADRNVPPAQSWSYFRALQYFGKPVKYVVFPGEPHGPRKLTHQMRKVEDEIAWFDQYFFKTAKPENEALKEGSPLDAALRAKSIAKTAGRYGSAFSAPKGKSILIPEVVKRGDLEIGRFEVTRAQFAEFDKTYKFDAGTDNYPANGITFDQAKSYAAWLAKTTNETWRIANESEVAGFYSKKDGENTLDYWAGYSLNPDDAARLEKKLSELSGPAPLLRPVGSFAGQGKPEEELVYDLGGNVAEWAISADGKGKVLGGSADQATDPAAAHTAAPSYIGFRVVRGKATSTAPQKP